MILKTMRKMENNLKKHSSEIYEVNYVANIKGINKVFNYDELFTSVNLIFNDNSSQILLLSEKENNAEKMLYENVFLLNDKGQTIDRLI